jgi:hypothetical protein
MDGMDGMDDSFRINVWHFSFICGMPQNLNYVTFFDLL